LIPPYCPVNSYRFLFPSLHVESCFFINNNCIQIPYNHCNKEDMPGEIVHHGCMVFGEINTGNLAVSTGYQLGLEDSIPFDFEYPLGLDAALALCNHRPLDLAPHPMIVHVLELLSDSSMPLGMLFQIFMVVSFVKCCGFQHMIFEGIFKIQGLHFTGSRHQHLVLV